MGLFKRDRNGQAPLREPNGAEVEITTQVPVEERHSNIVIVPQVPIEIVMLLESLGAMRVSSAIKSNDENSRFLLLSLPETMAFQGRYAREGEYNDGANDIHGWVPSSVHAPDNTLLFALNQLGSTTSTVGLTWVQTASLLVKHQGPIVLPKEIVFAEGTKPDFAHGAAWEKVVSGVKQEGVFPLYDRVKSEFALWQGVTVHAEGLEEQFEAYLAELRAPLGDIDSARGNLASAHLFPIINETPNSPNGNEPASIPVPLPAFNAR